MNTINSNHSVSDVLPPLPTGVFEMPTFNHQRSLRDVLAESQEKMRREELVHEYEERLDIDDDIPGNLALLRRRGEISHDEGIYDQEASATIFQNGYRVDVIDFEDIAVLARRTGNLGLVVKLHAGLVDVDVVRERLSRDALRQATHYRHATAAHYAGIELSSSNGVEHTRRQQIAGVAGRMLRGVAEMVDPSQEELTNRGVTDE